VAGINVYLASSLFVVLAEMGDKTKLLAMAVYLITPVNNLRKLSYYSC